MEIKANALIIIDPQNDFVKGSLAVPGAEEAMNNIIKFIEDHKQDLGYIAVTLDWHPLSHCSFKEFGGDGTYYFNEVEFNLNHFQTPIANGNIQARLRMIYLYNLASINKGIVFSTDNQTEYQLGFWTLHGDVGDFNPLFGLWKTEVYKLAKWIETMYGTMAEGADDAITMEKYLRKEFAIHKSIALTPTDGLGISSSDLEQIGASSYAEVDDILQTMLLYKNPESEKWDLLYDKYGEEVTDKVWNRHLASEFKRKNLPITIQRHEYSTDDD